MKRIFLHGFLLLFCFGMQAQETKSADFKHLEAVVSIDPEAGSVSGELVYLFDVLSPADSIYVDAQKMDFQEVFLNGKEIPFSNDGKKLWLKSDFSPSVDNQLKLNYSASPQQAMYFIETTAPPEEPEYQVWTQGQGKHTSNWLPSFDDPTEKLEFDLDVIYPSGETVVSNGLLESKEELKNGNTRWNFDMQQPMSSYLVAIAAGNFERREKITDGAVPLYFYFPPGKEDYVEPTYRHTGRIMNFLEEKTGVKYPWQNYKQVPVQDFLYAGMENTGTTIFSDILLTDSIAFKDRNYVNVNAHELAHQWFGNLITAASGEEHWLQEGFATYYALLAEKEIFGEDYYYWKLFNSAEELKEESDSGKGQPLINANANSLTYYQKGAWALHILKEKVGEKAFDEAVENYLEANKFGTVTTSEFLAEVEKTSGQDLADFRKNWLEQAAFQGTAALESLKKSEFIRDYLEIAALKPLPLKNKKKLFAAALDFPVNDYIGQEVVHQLALENPVEVLNLYKKAFMSNNWYVRQAISVSLRDIPQELKSQYENLLNDDSYVTREAALYNLWQNFPQERLRYLEKMGGVEGFTDKNIETLWLALNIATPEVDAVQRDLALNKLASYTRPHHRFQVRQNAFQFLFQLRAFDKESLENLLAARNHPNSRFRGFVRDLVKKISVEGILQPEEQNLLEQELNKP